LLASADHELFARIRSVEIRTGSIDKSATEESFLTKWSSPQHFVVRPTVVALESALARKEPIWVVGLDERRTMIAWLLVEPAILVDSRAAVAAAEEQSRDAAVDFHKRCFNVRKMQDIVIA
jgi:hypothetical protein